MKKVIIAGVIAAAIFALCGGGYYYLFADYQDYYTQVDNGQIKEINDDDMKYEYTLKAYDKDGNEKEYTFMTVRKLRQDAYLHLSTLPLRGVIEWEEIKPDKMPDGVKSVYNL